MFLPQAAIETLKQIPKRPGNPYVLTGPGEEGHLVNLRKPWHRIRNHAGLPDVRLHDLRHSFASVAAGEGMSLYIIGQLLGHTQSATTQRYAHLAARPMKLAAEQVGSRLDILLNPTASVGAPIEKRSGDADAAHNR